ncbi:MAG TPA: helix-turn-helix transcriptional regulator [Pseudogracilibacillus sp.]|nr:helix-turn-helix transcriptional regulator [Pseudogracilibacillus sp.]
MATIGEFIRKKREEKHISLRELAKQTGVSPAYISQLENNYRTNPTSHVLRSLAEGLQIPFEQFIEELQTYTNLQLKEFDSFYNQKDTRQKEHFDLAKLFHKDLTLYYNGRKLTSEERKQLEFKVRKFFKT